MLRSVLSVFLVAQVAAFPGTHLAGQEVDRAQADGRNQQNVENPQGHSSAESSNATPPSLFRTDAVRDSITAMFLAPGTIGRWRTTDSLRLQQETQQMSSTSKATVVVLCFLFLGAIALVAVAAAIGGGLGAG